MSNLFAAVSLQEFLRVEQQAFQESQQQQQQRQRQSIQQDHQQVSFMAGNDNKDQDQNEKKNENDKKRKTMASDEKKSDNDKESANKKQQLPSSAVSSSSLTPPALVPDKWTIHLIDMGPEQNEDDHDATEDQRAERVRDKILTDYPALVPHMKRGDGIEDLSAGGYRSAGLYFVENHGGSSSSLHVIPRSFDVDEYGSQPLHYTTLDAVPPNYFHPDNAQLNNMYHPQVTATNVYWHTDEGWNLISPALADQVVENEDDQGTLQYQGVTYTITNLEEAKLGPGQGLVTCDYNAETKTFCGGYC